MFEFKDYADQNALPADIIPVAKNPSGSISTITQQQAQDSYKKKGLTYGPDSARAIQQSFKLITGLGITNQPGPDTIPIGVNNGGQQLFSNKQFAESRDTGVGRLLNQTAHGNFSPANVFNDSESKKFLAIGDHASDPGLLSQLNDAKTNGDINNFRSSINRTVGTASDKKGDGTDFASSQLFDNWHNLSDGQKSLAIAGLGNQNFKFDDGTTLATKKVTPDIGNVRGMTPKDVAELQGTGTNPYPVVKHWDEMVTLLQGQFNPRSGISVSTNAQKLNLLGYGPDGSSVNINKENLDAIGARSEPHMGVGAISIPSDQTPPVDYVKIGNEGGRTQIIPKAHANTAITGTDTSVANAKSMYAKWAPVEVQKSVGVVGGNQMLAGTMALTDTNPQAVSTALTAKTVQYSKSAPANPGQPNQLAAFAEDAGKIAKGVKTAVSIYDKVNGAITSASSAGSSAAAASSAGADAATAAAGGGAVASSATTGGVVLADGTVTGSAAVGSGVNGGVLLADGTTAGASAGTTVAGTAVSALGSLAAAYGAYELTQMAVNSGDVHRSDTGANTVKGAASGAAAGSFFGPPGAAIGAIVGGTFGAVQGLTGSTKGLRQIVRDKYRSAIIDGKVPVFDKDYKGTLADGTTHDFGKDKFTFDAGKGNKDGNIDLSTAAGAKAAAYGNVIAAVQGITGGKARESVAALFASGALANGDGNVKDNAAHFLGELGVKDSSQIQAVLNKLRAEDKISDEDYKVFSNDSRELLAPGKGSQTRQLTSEEIDQVNGKGKASPESGGAAAMVQYKQDSSSDHKVAAFDGMVQHAASVAVNGDPAKPAELDYEAKKITDGNYKEQFKNIRASYAQKGISSKQIGLHLINQAYSEGRISELEYTSSYMTMHAVFDDNKTLYDSITTGAAAGRAMYHEKTFGKN